MNSEYAQNSSRENSVEQRKSMEELKRLNQPNSAPQQTAQTIQPIVIQCDLPQAMNKLLERVGNLSERYSCKWIRWLPDFSLLVAIKWIMLVTLLGSVALAGWSSAATILSLFP